jgi:secondary thiamine-phosphate synthase enzyme
MTVIEIPTDRREQLLDVTDEVQRRVASAGVQEGSCLVFSPHTTCAVTVNEGWDPDVVEDTLHHLRELVPQRGQWRHAEGNSDAHLKTMLIGPGVTLPVSGGRVRLGRWQKVFLCEFDGPRRRELWLTLSAGAD